MHNLAQVLSGSSLEGRCFRGRGGSEFISVRESVRRAKVSLALWLALALLASLLRLVNERPVRTACGRWLGDFFCLFVLWECWWCSSTSAEWVGGWVVGRSVKSVRQHEMGSK